MIYTIAVVSGNRATSQNFKTLKYLRRINISYTNVILFFEKNQQEEYLARDDVKYAISKGAKVVWLNCKNIADARNYIEKKYFNDGDKVLCLDDDIVYLNIKKEGKIKRLDNFKDLDFLIKKYFNMCIENNCKLWGLYPIARNDMWFEKTRDMIGNNHILAVFSGVIIDKSLPLQNIEWNCKEEYQRGFIYGKNIRSGDIAVHSAWYQRCGIGFRSFELQLKVCNELIEKYPKFMSKSALKINENKMTADLRLNRAYYK